MQIGIPMKGLRRNDDAMKTYSWYSKQLTQTASKTWIACFYSNHS